MSQEEKKKYPIFVPLSDAAVRFHEAELAGIRCKQFDCSANPPPVGKDILKGLKSCLFVPEKKGTPDAYVCISQTLQEVDAWGSISAVVFADDLSLPMTYLIFELRKRGVTIVRIGEDPTLADVVIPHMTAASLDVICKL
jgi:hypothetical protein